MKKKNKKKVLFDWDWTTLVAAWRYYAGRICHTRRRRNECQNRNAETKKVKE